MLPSKDLRRLTSLVLCGLLASCANPEADKRRHFERGNQYTDQKRYEHAILEYANAVRLDPKFGEARWKLAEAYEQTGDLQAAFREYVRAADALPDRRDAQIKAIDVLLLGGRFEDARTRATALTTKDPTDVDALLLLANALGALKDPEGATREIEEALKVRPNDSRTYLTLGTVHLRSGEAQQAESAFKQAIAMDPSSVNVHLALANYLWSADRLPEAEDAIKRATALQPQHVLANRMLGVLYLATDRLSEAEHPLKTVAEISGTTTSRLLLADYYRGIRRYKDATRLLTELATDPGTFADAESRLASIEYAGGNRAEAHKRLDATLERAPNNAPALAMKAQWLTSENKLDEALARAQAAVIADPQSASSHYVLAVVYDRRGEVPAAITSYNEVLRLNPQAAGAQVQLSRLSLASGNQDAAVQYAEEAHQTQPTSSAVRLALVRSLLARGDFVRAEVEIASLLKKQPNDAIVHSLDGALQRGRGDTVAARKAFERALELSPDLIDAIEGLITIDLLARQVAAAAARVESELARRPDNPELLALAAQVYVGSGALPKAEQALRRAVTVDPRFATGYSMLAQLYLLQQRPDQARAEFEGIALRDPSAVEARTMVGVLLEAQNKRSEARKWYEATMAATDKAPVAANNLAFIYAEEGTNLDAALQLASAAKRLLPDDPDVDDTLGWIYYKKDMATRAVGPLEESVQRRPTRVEFLYHLGLTYAKLGENAKAREMLERALALNPHFAGADTARDTLLSVLR